MYQKFSITERTKSRAGCVAPAYLWIPAFAGKEGASKAESATPIPHPALIPYSHRHER